MSASPAQSIAALVRTARDTTASLHDRHAAFTELVSQSQQTALGLALALLRNADDANDAAQDAYVTAWRRLRQLRDGSAFLPWLKAIVARECAHRRRRRAPLSEPTKEPLAAVDEHSHLDNRWPVLAALGKLPDAEREVIVLFYFLGHTVPQMARLLRLKPGTVGKRLHAARLRLRREMPRSVRSEFVRVTPTPAFVQRVRSGLLDEYIGEYRFDQRPDLVVSIKRDGDALISEAGGQRHVLISSDAKSLLTRHYDGEGRFQRDRRGRITQFVYYEFGKRMGVARRIESSVTTHLR